MICMYACMVITCNRVWMNRVRLPNLLVVSGTVKIRCPYCRCIRGKYILVCTNVCNVYFLFRYMYIHGRLVLSQQTWLYIRCLRSILPLGVQPTMQELTDAIHSLANGKAVGPDGVSVETFKITLNGNPALRRRLLDIIVRIWRGGEVP